MMKMGTGVEWNEGGKKQRGTGRHLGFKFSEGLDFGGDRQRIRKTKMMPIFPACKTGWMMMSFIEI